jgi:ribosomal protein S14
MRGCMDDDSGFNDVDCEPVELPPLPDTADQRWHCRHCGSLALLDDDGLCRHCWRESVATFAEVAGWMAHRDRRQAVRRWWIR